jgi:hypothetical protein
MLKVHALYISVIRNKGERILSKRFLFEDWPVFKILPGAAVTVAATRSPLFTIIRCLCGSAVQHTGKTFFLPIPPLPTTPALSSKGFFDEAFCFRTIAPVAEV